jgi:polyisoprenoid-binding protein YceI
MTFLTSPQFVVDLLTTAIPLIVGGFLAGLFTYAFELRRIRGERTERRAVILESLRRELAFLPEELPAYRAGAVHFLPPIRTVVGGQLLDGQVLDYRTDALLIQPLLEFLGIAAIYNDLVTAVNAGQAGNAWSEEVQRHWHGQLLGAHGSLINTRRALLAQVSSESKSRVASKPADVPLGPLPAPGDGWQVDLDHSHVGFSAKHMGIVTVHGHFTRVEVRLELDELNPTRSTVEARIDAASVNTSDERRDADLRSAHFLDATSFPWIVFVSTAIEALGPNSYRLAGDLTIRDTTRPISLEMRATPPIADGRGALRRGFSAVGQINRADWGLTWNVALETGAWLVSEEVQLELEIAAFGPAGSRQKART